VVSIVSAAAWSSIWICLGLWTGFLNNEWSLWLIFFLVTVVLVTPFVYLRFLGARTEPSTYSRRTRIFIGILNSCLSIGSITDAWHKPLDSHSLSKVMLAFAWSLSAAAHFYRAFKPEHTSSTPS
jgi:hypothetical protein